MSVLGKSCVITAVGLAAAFALVYTVYSAESARKEAAARAAKIHSEALQDIAKRMHGLADFMTSLKATPREVLPTLVKPRPNKEELTDLRGKVTQIRTSIDDFTHYYRGRVTLAKAEIVAIDSPVKVELVADLDEKSKDLQRMWSLRKDFYDAVDTDLEFSIKMASARGSALWSREADKALHALHMDGIVLAAQTLSQENDKK